MMPCVNLRTLFKTSEGNDIQIFGWRRNEYEIILLFGEVENIWADKYGIYFYLRFNFSFEILGFGLKFKHI